MPADYFRADRRRVAALSKVLVVLAAAAGLWGLQARHSAPPSTPAQPPSPVEILSRPPLPPVSPPRTPTLEELSRSTDMMIAASVIEIQVERFHADWEVLVPIYRDTLCRAGKSIRSSMHTYNNTVADLNQVQRAIYDITKPSGRCRFNAN